jgi:hypothetical protein
VHETPGEPALPLEQVAAADHDVAARLPGAILKRT